MLNAAELKPRESCEFLTFKVKRLTRDSWILTDSRVTSRSRFGNLHEISADIAYVELYGVLPPRSQNGWS